MGLFKTGQGSRGFMRLLLIQLVCCLGWFSSFVIAQFEISEGVTGSLNYFPTLGITCVGNLAVFVTSLIRGRLDLEIGARDVLDILSSRKLVNIESVKHGNGLVTCKIISTSEEETIEVAATEKASVVMLSNGPPNWSTRQFLRSNAPIVHSVVLQFLSLQDAADDAKVREEQVIIQGRCGCSSCNCIVFWTMEDITIRLASWMPGTLKRLSDSLCLLPCLTCLRNGCHGCNEEGLLRVEGPLPLEQANEGYRLRESESKVVSEILNDIPAESINGKQHICICIPVHGSSSDVWTELLVRSLRSKDAEGRGVRVMASEALEGYLGGRRGGAKESVEYNISSFILPRFTEILINLVLTLWFKVDGFSSALVARRTIRDYLVDTKGSGLAANAFLTKVKVQFDDNCTQVCQVLFFRGNYARIITLSTGCVNLISSLCWALLISFEGGPDSSPPPSMTIIAVIIAAIAADLGMDLACSLFQIWGESSTFEKLEWIIISVISPIIAPPMIIVMLLRRDGDLPNLLFGLTFWTIIALETACMVSGSAVAGTHGIKAFGRWVYGALQILVWLKWAFGSVALTSEISIEFRGRNPGAWQILVYCSAFMLNAVLAGVRCKWEPWPWKGNHLFPRKLRP